MEFRRVPRGECAEAGSALGVVQAKLDPDEFDIASLLGCAEGTVRSLAARAFETMRRDPRLAPQSDPTAAREER